MVFKSNSSKQLAALKFNNNNVTSLNIGAMPDAATRYKSKIMGGCNEHRYKHVNNTCILALFYIVSKWALRQ